jgi:hypothetical protein
LSSALHYPPNKKTLLNGRVFLLWLTIFLPCMAGAQQNIGEVYASDASVKGNVRYTASGLEISNGSVISAGEHSASLRLARGGQVRICPGTSLTVNASPQGQELMFAMSAGSLEGEYQLPATADALLTPDFRIVVSGPAKVSLSVTADAKGNACVRSGGEESYVVVSELMSDDFYRVKPNEQVVFHSGHARNPEVNGDMRCGCPAPAPLERAEVSPPPPTPPAPTPQQNAAAIAAVQNEPAVAAAANAAAALPQQPSGQVEVQVDAPMVFRGTGAAPDVTATLARVHVERIPWPQTPTVVPEPPSRAVKTKPEALKGEKKGFFHRLVKRLFG